MFARFRNLFAKTKAEDDEQETMLDVPSIVVDGPPKEEDDVKETHQIASLTVHNTKSCAPLATEEEDLSNGHEEGLSGSTNELSKLLEAINESTKLPELSSEDNETNDGEEKEEEEEEDDDDDDETASTSSVKTKIAKASIERDIILEEQEEEEDEEDEMNNIQLSNLHSLDKIKALIRNDSETYPQSDYTDNDTEDPTPSHSRTASMDSTAGIGIATGQQLDSHSNLPTDFSVVADELPLDSSPSPLHDSGRTSSAGSEVLNGETPSPATLKILPTGSNELACAAITHKLSAIAEVAESLDAVIRDVQQEGEDHGPSGNKKLGTIEDWQSRSTEDESFATASEGNFTPNSHSSSFQTASGRTSSYIGSAKNSFDEADDSTLSTFEIPELPQSPVHNMSFDSSELSYFSAQQPMASKADDQDSVAGVADLHSQSVTPTPDDEQQQQQHLLLSHPMPQPIESDSELEGFGLASGITTELAPSVSTAQTPEVSAHCRNNAPAQAHALAPVPATAPTTNPNETKPPASWRRSKYYENITKQTIKGFL